MHLLHDISPGNANEMNIIIECPRGSKNKYEIDKETGRITLDRVLHTSQDFPVEYGFVPRTLWDDGDALDAVLLSTYPFSPGILVRARPVALVRMIDGGESDFKILGVPTHDPRYDHVQDLADVNPHVLKEIKHFFETYKGLQSKEVVIESFGDASAARDAFERAVKLYADAHAADQK